MENLYYSTFSKTSDIQFWVDYKTFKIFKQLFYNTHNVYDRPINVVYGNLFYSFRIFSPDRVDLTSPKYNRYSLNYLNRLSVG